MPNRRYDALMRSGWFAAFLLFLFGSLVPALSRETSIVTNASAPPVQPRSEGLKHSLWEVKGRTNTIYLLGSVHLLKEENYPLPLPIETAYSNCETAVFETDIGDVSGVLKMFSRGALPEGE